MNNAKVIISISLHPASSRDVLMGFLQYFETSSEWMISLMQSEVNPMTVNDLQKVEKEGVAAIIITRQCSDELSAALAETPIPLVCIGIRDERFKTRQRPTVYVHNDNSAIGDIGARHFASLGRFCSYGFVLSDGDGDWGLDRANAFCSRIAASAANTPACVFRTSASSNPKTNISKLSEWIKSLPKPAAVMASCDQRAIEVLSACERAHISVPDAVAVLGVDNDEFLCAHASPPLSSVMPGHREMGRIAAETLGKLRSRKSIARRCSVVTVPPCKVVERESTHRRPPSAILVERTRNFIREHATNGIDVQAVVSHLGVSRRLVEKRWREATGGTIRSAIEEARMAKLKKLLGTTRMKVSAIAEECGYRDPDALSHLFRKRFGMSMRDWRRANQHGGSAKQP